METFRAAEQTVRVIDAMTESIKANNKSSGNAITFRESEKMLKKLNNLRAECVKFTTDLEHNFHALRLMIWENTGSSQILTLSQENGAKEFMQNLSRITEAENPDMAVLLQQGLQEMQNANALFLKKIRKDVCAAINGYRTKVAMTVPEECQRYLLSLCEQ